MVMLNDKNYGVPEQKKFPLDSADHVRSAIKFFNYVQPEYEKELAKAILKKAKEYNVDLSEMNIGDNNRFKKYLPNELMHFGILGQKWGVRRYQNEDGTLTEEGKRRYGTVGIDAKISREQINTDRANLTKRIKASDPRTKKIKEYEKQANDLARKYNFDGDDGGGGRTEADRRAGKKYMELWYKIKYIQDQITSDALKETKRQITEKYGEKRIKDIENSKKATGYAFAASILAIWGGTIYHLIKNA